MAAPGGARRLPLLLLLGESGGRGACGAGGRGVGGLQGAGPAGEGRGRGVRLDVRWGLAPRRVTELPGR